MYNALNIMYLTNILTKGEKVMSLIIDSKDPKGKRVCVTMDDVLFAYLELALPKSITGRKFIQNGIKDGSIKNIIDARNETYKRIVKPSLLNKYNDGQTDIEDFC